MNDPKILFWIVASVADAAAININSIKTFLANRVNTFFINAEPALINGPGKFSNPPSWLIILPVVSFKKIPLFSKDLVTLQYLLYHCVIPELLIDESPFLFF